MNAKWQICFGDEEGCIGLPCDEVWDRYGMCSLTQRMQEVEHNLQTMQLQKYKATEFSGQFGPFYRRLDGHQRLLSGCQSLRI